MAITTNNKRYADLVRSFHVFEDIDVLSISLQEFDELAYKLDPDGTDGVKCTAAFLLNLWTRRMTWECGEFDMFEAVRQWDDRHMAAFSAWAINPWLP